MKSNHLITACIIHIFITVYSQDNVINSTMLKQHVFANAPKEWFKYITKYLQRKLSKRHLHLNEIYIFLKIKNFIIDDDKPLKFIRDKTIIYLIGFVRRNLEEPTLGNPYFDDYPPRKVEEDKIMFVLDEKLCLNLTFHHIHFGFRHLHTCSVGEVRLIIHSKNKQVFRYCGIHSNMINYPQNRKVSIFFPTITERRKILGIYNVTAFYSVIDTNRIVTLQQYRLLWKNLLWNLYLVPKDIRVMKFALRTEKYQHFILKFTIDSELIVELFDGPGTHSANIFKKNNESHITSTFQSIIYMWIPATKKLNVECGFQFLSQFSSIKMNIQLNDSLQHIISHVFTKYEVLKIISYYNVNLTIINLTYTGFNDPLCTFAGMTVHSLNKDSYKEISTECMSFINILPYRNIYSKSNETLLVLYSYKEYGNLSLTIQFSTIKCKPVTINTCALSFLCKFLNNTMCKEHREQIKALNLKYSQIGTNFPISVKPEQCFILQMVAVVDRIRVKGCPYDCKINFYHINVLNSKIDIYFNIKAYLKCKYIISNVSNR